MWRLLVAMPAVALMWLLGIHPGRPWWRKLWDGLLNSLATFILWVAAEKVEVRVAIRTVMIFDNGLCAVFDYQGKQVGEMQGYWQEMSTRVLPACDSQTRFEDYRP